MTIMEQLAKISSAEDFFEFLDVPYDPEVLDTARLHILKRMGEYLRNSPEEPEQTAAMANFRTHLERAYQDFVCSTPLNERVFKVLKDAVRPKAKPLVSLTVPKKETLRK
jgi:nitrogenase-stabilizing/protective protein